MKTPAKQYKEETGKDTHQYGGVPEREYVDWLENRLYNIQNEAADLLIEKAEKLEEAAIIQAKFGNVEVVQNKLNMANNLRMSAAYLK